MEFNKLGVDKGAGLKHLAEILGIGIEETIAVGDNYNDNLDIIIVLKIKTMENSISRWINNLCCVFLINKSF